MSHVDADLAIARDWWDSLRPEVPPGLAGLWFGLFDAADEDGGQTRTLYVVGTAEFDADDETGDWAADDYLWESKGRYVVLPKLAALPSNPYEVPLAHAAAVVRALEPWRALPGVGVAVGYDDGDLEVVHRE